MRRYRVGQAGHVAAELETIMKMKLSRIGQDPYCAASTVSRETFATIDLDQSHRVSLFCALDRRIGTQGGLVRLGIASPGRQRVSQIVSYQ